MKGNLLYLVDHLLKFFLNNRNKKRNTASTVNRNNGVMSIAPFSSYFFKVFQVVFWYMKSIYLVFLGLRIKQQIKCEQVDTSICRCFYPRFEVYFIYFFYFSESILSNIGCEEFFLSFTLLIQLSIYLYAGRGNNFFY